jgi:4-amino-4-deoxy-L-arabinose transferase-like glycosyltransferase
MTTVTPGTEFVPPFPADPEPEAPRSTTTSPPVGGAPAHAAAPSSSRVRRLWRGQESDPAWVRPSLLALMLTTGVLNLWGLSASGWANAFYSAAVQAASQDWAAFLFGSSDAANLITVDKPPASLWVMALSVRLFGLSSWSILVPQALMGVATMGLLYLAVRRWSTHAAGLIAGAVLVLTPVATLMFRFNNPDALLVLLLVAAAYTTIRATERASLRWLVATGVLVGFAFLTKSLQAFLPLPAFALVYLLAAPTTFGRRIRDLLVAGVAMVVAGGWWVALVELWPSASRPYIGGSQTNSAWELIMGYNGLGRITGDEVGSITGGGGGNAGGMWGETGWGRLFSSSYGGQIAWLMPAAIVLAAAVLVLRGRAPRTDTARAAVILWTGWLAITGAVISFASGIIHEYYTVALAPAIGALVGIGVVELWRARESFTARFTLALTIAGSSVWAAVLLARAPDWYPALRSVVIGIGTLSALLILLLDRLGARPAIAAVGTGIVAVLLAPAAYSVQTSATSHTGSLPVAGPTVAGGRGGPGGAGGPQGMRGGPPPTAGRSPQGSPAFGVGGPGAQGRPGGGAGGAGGLLDASTPSTELQALLLQDADSFTWVAAAVGAQTAAGYQLATEQPVMSLGGFNGSDPWPTLDVFRQYVAQGQVHYFIVGGTGMGRANGGSSATSEIAAWVAENFTATTVGGVTVYDLTVPAAGATASSATA